MTKKDSKIMIGIIGGSGLDDPKILKNAKDLKINTPYGKPSDALRIGTIEGVDVAILARHGRLHTIPPTEVNNRANIWALKKIGVTHIIATTAVGSLREKIGRGDLVILDQFIDFTRRRHISYRETFEPHKPLHTPMADPFSKEISKLLIESCKELKLRHHNKGTVVTIEGARFSTRAESKMFRLWGADVINMSIAPECGLANEMSIPYAGIAMATDYDCWKEDEEPVTWQAVLKIFEENVEKVIRVLLKTIPRVK
jgi:5'-methylthioadenosine phosphorylase